MMNEKNTNAMFPIEVSIESESLAITLDDGTIVSSPLALYPWLASASQSKQAGYELGRFSIDWPELGEGIDVNWFINDVDTQVTDSGNARILRRTTADA